MAEVVLHLVRDDAFSTSDESELEDIDETLSEIDDTAVDMDEIEGVDEEAEIARCRGRSTRWPIAERRESNE